MKIKDLADNGLIEPGAVEMSSGYQDSSPNGLLMSIAISAKRIADALSIVHDPVKMNEVLFSAGHSLGAGVEQVAFSIGQQFSRGDSVG